MKILYYHAVISDGSGHIRCENEFTVEELNVIGENDINLVVDDLHFTTIHKSKQPYSTVLGIPGIYVYVNDNVWGNRISYSLYTFNNKPASRIRKEIEKHIEEKFGFFTGKLDLSIIKEPRRA